MALKTYYFKSLEKNNYIKGRGKLIVSKKPESTSTKIIISKAEFDYLEQIIKDAPLPADDEHEIKIRDNLDGTYDYVEVLKPIEEFVEE